MAGDVAYLVRHGDYEDDSEALTSLGREQSIAAREALIARDLGGRAYLLSSSAPRSMETAQIIGEGLDVKVIPSALLYKKSNTMHQVKVLGEFLNECLRTDADIYPVPGKPIIAVVHAPLIASMTKKDSVTDIANGGVYEVPLDATDPYL